MISWFYAYVEHIEIKTKTVNIIHFPYIDLSQNVKIRHNFEQHHNNLSSVNYLMTTVKIESIHSFTFTYPFVYNTHEIKTFPLFLP
jgi:hypothetical protein